MSTAAARLLDTARADLLAGQVERAWQSCRAAARIGRSTGDAAVVADAATIIRGGPIGAWDRTAEQHALCREALGMLGDDADPRLRARVEAQFAATSNPWTREPGRTAHPDADDRFLWDWRLASCGPRWRCSTAASVTSRP